MSAPRDLINARHQLAFVLGAGGIIEDAITREHITAALALLESLIVRCNAPDADRAAIESLRSADAAE